MGELDLEVTIYSRYSSNYQYRDKGGSIKARYTKKVEEMGLTACMSREGIGDLEELTSSLIGVTPGEYREKKVLFDVFKNKE